MVIRFGETDSLIIKNNMTIPLKKVLLTTVRYLMRPINNTINRKFKSLPHDDYRYKAFMNFG